MVLGIVAFCVIVEAAELNVTISRRDDGITYDALFDIDAPQKILSGLQIDIGCNPDQTLIQSIQASDAVIRQDKQLSSSQPERGVVRVLVVGANAFPILNGDVLKVTFVMQGPQVETVGVLQIRSISAVSPEGDVVDLRTTDVEGPDPGRSLNARQSRLKRYTSVAGHLQRKPR